MTIFNFYIFDRDGSCVYYTEWKRPRQPSVSKIEVKEISEFKLLYGMIISLKSFINKLSPSENKTSFRSFQTTQYKMTFFETPTGLKFVMNTDRNAPAIYDLLRQIFAEVYVPYVAKNPRVAKNEEIKSDVFVLQLNGLVQKHSSFA